MCCTFFFQPFRLTPVHTGNARRVPAGSTLKQAHPRAYGERAVFIVLIFKTVGSSPRIRGTLRFIEDRINAFGLIPAHTGNALNNGGGDKHLGAHPRAYGERT